jgi:hypothetical protein
MYKLISVDLDGTLLNSRKKISKENKEAIELAIEKGVKVVVCSGRVFKGARVYARELNIREPLISCNGAVIRDIKTDEMYYSNLLRKDDCYNIIDICRKENIYFHVYIDNDVYTEKPECPSVSYWRGNSEQPEEDRVKVYMTDDFNKVVNQSSVQVSKFVAISRDFGLLSKVRTKIEGINNVDVMSSNHDNFEVVNKGVNKGTALKFLSEKLKIESKEIIAIGDNENDLEMLKYAGFRIAMGNAEKSVKEIADHITLSNDENGVAEAIMKLVL